MIGDIIERTLSIELTPQELISRGHELGEKLARIPRMEEARKANAAEAKAAIDLAKAESQRLAGILATGKEDRKVRCRWETEGNGKVLYRLDTREIVDKAPLEPDERQRDWVKEQPEGEDFNEDGEPTAEADAS